MRSEKKLRAIGLRSLLDVEILAAVKTRSLEEVEAAMEAGIRILWP